MIRIEGVDQFLPNTDKKGKSGVVLGFYQNPAAASLTLQQLRRKHFRCSALVQRLQDGRFITENSVMAPWQGGLLGGGLGFVLGWLLGFPPPPLAVFTLICLSTGALVARVLGRGVDDDLLARYRRWLVHGESMIAAQTSPQALGRAMSILRQAGDGTAAFGFRVRDLAVPTAVAESFHKDAVNAEQLGVHAARIAAELETGRPGFRAESLLMRLHRSQRILGAVRRALNEAAQMGQGLTAGAEWFLDNAYLIQGQIAEILRNLPKAYQGQLPVLAAGPLAGLPRLYGLVTELISHTDGRLDRESIATFLTAFQSITPLSIGELWAVPLILRYGLLESLRHLSLRVYYRQHEQEQADFWANRLLTAARSGPDPLLFTLAELARENPRPSAHFAIRLVGHLSDEAAALVPLQVWLERKLDVAFQEELQQERSRLAGDQVSIANAVNSLRYLARLQWHEVFEEVSLVETVLRQDPAGVYREMDFATRSSYRNAVEEVARWSGRDEIAASRRAMDLAQAEEDPRRRHLGYYLIGAGRGLLEDALACRVPLARRAARWVRGHATPVYLGSIAGLTAAILAMTLLLAGRGQWNVGGRTLAALLILIPASELAVQTVNRAAMRFFPPAALPRISFSKGIPSDCRTLIVIPMMLASPEVVKGEIDRLEVRYLANPDPALHYALLADLPDASAPEIPADGDILALAGREIASLNERHGADRFLLLSRPRTWSRSEERWICWERKRGKLEELNRLLNGEPSGVVVQNARTELIRGIRFVITLDSDTQLPRDSARQLVETMAHPLNQARLSADGRSVVEGYSIIQPRVCTSLPSAVASRFARLFADPTGLDPYCHTVSDVYQDLVDEGTFYGKGIYDPRVFHQVLGGRFPEATILSHDLLEGAYLRTGLASDIVLLDLFPRSYQTFARRQHRWVRGDWQIAAWLLPRVPTADGGRAANPLSALNRWKIFDNMRRSLVPPILLALLVLGWLVFPRPAAAGLLAGLVLFFPSILNLLNLAVSGIRGGPAWREMGTCLVRNAALLALLPHQAYLALDAISRSFYRQFYSRRNLLEWETAQTAHWRYHAGNGERRFIGRLTLASLFALGLALLVLTRRQAAFSGAIPFLLPWMVSPLVAWYLGSNPPRRDTALTPQNRLMLREVARQTWRYFDRFVEPDNHWLPPDNYQEALNREVARRTSPTNIGMWLLSALAAHDLGYLTMEQLVARTTATMATLRRLEKYEGHLLNWYNTETLEPLRPRFISTVDSGNLLACLWTFVRGCRELSAAPLIGPRVMTGLEDTLANLRHAFGSKPRIPAADALEGLAKLLTTHAGGTDDLVVKIRRAAELTGELAAALRADQASEPEQVYWADRLAAESAAWMAWGVEYLSWREILTDPPLPLDEPMREICARALAEPPTLAGLAGPDPPWLEDLRGQRPALSEDTPIQAWLDRVLAELDRAGRAAAMLLARLESLAAAALDQASGMDMGFLYDPERRLFAVGYNINERRLDNAYYDLLASEARLASFVAIARGEVPNEHWVALGRPFGRSGGEPILLSWNGTMFEYLMPVLLNHPFRNSLLDQACHTAVAYQMAYGRRRGIPWGISEAAFSALDSHQIYQYRAFGVPGLGLKRGLEEDLVVAPYATALALAVDPRAAVENLRRLTDLGLRGLYGFYESIDFTRARRPAGERGVIIYAYMAHHQGMSLVAMANALLGDVMRARFHADPRVRATESLLFERIPFEPPPTSLPDGEGPPLRLAPIVSTPAVGRVTTANTSTPRTQLLGNGDYSLMVTNAGGGYSRWRGIDLTRWRADTTRDSWGSFCYLRDLKEGAAWSNTYHPLGQTGRRYAVDFAVDRVEFRRVDVGIETATTIVVSPEDDAEIRRLTLTNLSGQTRYLELTSYLELALAPHLADRAHPAFSKIFVETEALPGQGALLARRRPRSPDEAPVWAGHVLALESPALEPWQYETDRARFLGRGRSPGDPTALHGPLSNSAGAVLDPLFSLRCRVAIEPSQHLRLALITLAAETRQGALAMIEKYRELVASENAIELAWNHAQLELRHFGIQVEEAQRFQELGGHALYPNPRLRPGGDRLRRNTLGQSRLWAYGISGDLPIVTITVDNAGELGVVREALLAHTYLRVKGLQTDLVILNGEAAGYGQPLQEELRKLALAHSYHTGLDQPGGVFLRSINQMPEEDLTLLQATARVTLVAARGSLAQQLAAPVEGLELPPRIKANRRLAEEPSPPLPFMELPYFNGLGGFTYDGREYAIYLGPDSRTPAPWINVLANPSFGALISESGAGSAWYGNSQLNRLTPWANDPVTDPVSDAIYLRDEETGVFWTPTPLPVREQDAYRARHGQGYTVFEHNSHAIEQELTIFVPVDQGDAPIRVTRLRLRNRSSRRRRLSIFTYVEWALGPDREETQAHIVSKWDGQSHALLARNAYHPDFGGTVAFAALSPAVVSFTADRTEFLGRNGGLSRPAALDRRFLSGRTGAGLDPCAAQQTLVELEPGRTVEVFCLIGAAPDIAQVRRLVRHYRDSFNVEEAFGRTKAWWDKLLTAVQIETPVLSVNLLLNRWLLYQTLSCRVWARAAYYQASGAYGFRDQLQDVLALLHAAPETAREHILRAAGRQFVEGDVQHWWHPPSGGGTRTRCADDLLWLPYAVAHYVRVTGDTSILDVRVPFLDGRLLEEGEQEIYLVPSISMEDGTLFEHCRRAVKRGLTTGPHGLPLIGTGDWNDGLNRVGQEGRGESVWLAWFLVDVLHGLAELCPLVGEPDQAGIYDRRAEELARTVEAQAWDGAWYRRAYYDDGTPLGSRAGQEARIDSVPQSWAVISGAADPGRAALALQAAEDHLIRWEGWVAALFWPPFDRDAHDPGYVKGYPPGVRENGGQYTHAALWLAMAYARRGEGDRAGALLRLLNPVEHARIPADVERYRVEPYVVAADVYTQESRLGQGGWTWYTGSSGWMYRVWLEEVLGVKRRGNRLLIEPAIPSDWPRVVVRYRYGRTVYEITVENPDRVSHGVARMEIDGETRPIEALALTDDGKTHVIRVMLGRGERTSAPPDAVPSASSVV